MAELEWDTTPERPSLRRAIRHRLHRLDPSLRVVAEGFLGAESHIDLLAVGGEGELVSMRIGHDGEDAALLTRSLSDLAWLQPRIADLFKLAPELGIEPSAEVRALLFCPDFSAETRTAIGSLQRGNVELIEYRCYRHRGQLSVVLEIQKPNARSRFSPATRESTVPESTEPSLHHAREPVRDAAWNAMAAPDRPESTDASPEPTRTVGFRTGLSDADLRVEIDEGKPLRSLPRA